MKTMIEACVACQTVGPNNPHEPMRITPSATEPLQSSVIDFYGPIPQGGLYLLVVTDTYSKKKNKKKLSHPRQAKPAYQS